MATSRWRLADAPHVVRYGLYALYLCATVLSILYLLFWMPYQRTLHARWAELPPEAFGSLQHVPAATHRRLGRVSVTDKHSQFLRFDTDKPAGGLRICALGDSFTAGTEAAETHDYPSRLQAQFTRAGVANVQVLNFGIGWYGFSQVSVMWHEVAARFQCDVVLLMPYAFWAGRDTTFNHAQGIAPQYLHARHVVAGGTLRQLEPHGDTEAERFADYVRFAPRWRYLRYDRATWPLFKALLPEGKRIPNWLYHDPRSPVDEVRDVYPRLLARVADSTSALVLVVTRPGSPIGAALRQVRRRNLSFLTAEPPSGFPYRAHIWHYGAWGNEHLARRVFDALSGGQPSAERFVLQDLPRRRGASARLSLHALDAVAVEWAGQRAGVFVPLDLRKQGLDDDHLAGIFRERKVAALLAIRPPWTAVTDACQVPLDAPPADGTEAWLWSGEPPQRRQRLGVVRRPEPNLPLASLDIEGVECPQHGPLALRAPTGQLESTEPFEVRMGQHTVLHGRATAGRIYLLPARGSLYRLRATRGFFCEPRCPDAEDTLFLTLSAGTRKVRVPWQRALRMADLDGGEPEPPLAAHIGLRNGHATLDALP